LKNELKAYTRQVFFTREGMHHGRYLHGHSSYTLLSTETKDAVNNLAANTKATVLNLEPATAQAVFSIKHEFENQSLATQLLLHNLFFRV
jgi:hypothetical protein